MALRRSFQKETSFTSGTEYTPWSQGVRQDAEPQGVPLQILPTLLCSENTGLKSMRWGHRFTPHLSTRHPERPGSGYWSSFFLHQVMTLDLMHLLPETLPPQLLLILPLWPIITFLGNMTFLTCLLPTLPHF